MLDAPACRKLFISATKRALKLVERETLTPRRAIASLRRLYDKLVAQYLRGENTTYATWLEHGPKGELDELLAATDPAIWDRLVENYDGRSI